MGDLAREEILDDLSDAYAEAQRRAFRDGFERGLNECRQMEALVAHLHDERDAAHDRMREAEDDSQAAENARGEYVAYVDVLEYLAAEGVEI